MPSTLSERHIAAREIARKAVDEIPGMFPTAANMTLVRMRFREILKILDAPDKPTTSNVLDFAPTESNR